MPSLTLTAPGIRAGYGATGNRGRWRRAYKAQQPASILASGDSRWVLVCTLTCLVSLLYNFNSGKGIRVTATYISLSSYILVIQGVSAPRGCQRTCSPPASRHRRCQLFFYYSVVILHYKLNMQALLISCRFDIMTRVGYHVRDRGSFSFIWLSGRHARSPSDDLVASRHQPVNMLLAGVYYSDIIICMFRWLSSRSLIVIEV